MAKNSAPKVTENEESETEERVPEKGETNTEAPVTESTNKEGKTVRSQSSF